MLPAQKKAMIEEIEALKKQKHIKKHFSIMFDDYFEIVEQLVNLYEIVDAQNIVKRTYLDTFRINDVVFATTYSRFKFFEAAGHSKTFTNKDEQDFYITIINPFDTREYVDLNYEAVEKAILQSREKLDKKDKSRVVFANVIDLNPESLPKLFERAFEENDGKVVGETQTEKQYRAVIAHETLHTLKKVEIFDQNGNEIRFIGGTTNRNLHEGMTEFLTKRVIDKNKNFYGIKQEYKPTYEGYVLYCCNINIIFKNSIEKIYFGGLQERKSNKYKCLDVSVADMMTDFEIMDRNSMIVNEMLKKFGKNVNLDEIEPHLKEIDNIYQKQMAWFDDMQKHKMLDVDVGLLKHNLNSTIRYMCYTRERFRFYFDVNKNGDRLFSLYEDGKTRLGLIKFDEAIPKPQKKRSLISKIVKKSQEIKYKPTGLKNNIKEGMEKWKMERKQ